MNFDSKDHLLVVLNELFKAKRIPKGWSVTRCATPSVGIIYDRRGEADGNDKLHLTINTSRAAQLADVVIFARNAGYGIYASETLTRSDRNPSVLWAVLHGLPRDVEILLTAENIVS